MTEQKSCKSHNWACATEKRILIQNETSFVHEVCTAGCTAGCTALSSGIGGCSCGLEKLSRTLL